MNTCECLRQEIETTQAVFQRLLGAIPEEALSLPSENPAWNIRKVLFHIAVIPRYMIVEVAMIRRQVRLLQLLPRLIPKVLFDWLDVHLTRLGARGMSCQRLAEVYDQSCLAALRALDSVPDADFGKSLHYPLWDPLLSGDVTVAYLFGYVKRHFDSHFAQIESTVEEKMQ